MGKQVELVKRYRICFYALVFETNSLNLFNISEIEYKIYFDFE